ncbi:hypothetical protein F4Y59_06880, partial [Candidatus Poribacteria bacterium]|nr:hypothetical protein [Candidatus Poribacteria bacterium]
MKRSEKILSPPLNFEPYKHAGNYRDTGGHLSMDALKNILALIIIGLTAISAYAQEDADTVLGPQPANTVKQSEETATNQAPSASVTQPSVNAMLLVRKISFEGVKTASEDMLRTLIQTQIGSEVSEELLTEDLKSLYKDTGFFSELEVDVRPFEDSGLEIVYKVVESPKISGINIIGNENLGLGKLKDELTLRPSEIYSDRRRWESERALRQLYHEKGYYLVGIQTHLDASKTDETSDPDEENTVQVTFEINEGPRVRIEEINIIGNAQVTNSKLEKKLKTRTGKPFDQMLFEEEDLSLNLRNYYQDLGFAQVKILGYEKRFTEDKTGLVLDITVDEGPEFIIGTYTLELEGGAKTLFSEKKIRNMLDPAEGEIFNRATFDESIGKLQQAYLDKGYLLSEILPIPIFDEENGVVNITLQ